jgi:hypothetical protein
VNPSEILDVLDANTHVFSFPMLDNGYVYLAATRLALYRSTNDWAMVIQVFGYSPRAQVPDLHVHTFASRLHERDPESAYVTRASYENYLTQHPHDEHRFVFPIADGEWVDIEDVAVDATSVTLRGEQLALPPMSAYEEHGIELKRPPRIAVFELCRYLADAYRERVLATPEERRVSVPPELDELMVLDDWCHPDVVIGELPSDTETFRQLATVLETGDASGYQPTHAPNTHWRHWPDGGSL